MAPGFECGARQVPVSRQAFARCAQSPPVAFDVAVPSSTSRPPSVLVVPGDKFQKMLPYATASRGLLLVHASIAPVERRACPRAAESPAPAARRPDQQAMFALGRV